ncbi:hypothetical protein [Gilvimarinus polysaccharolyticus]|uniref:hypothetical protein n=1 Tax=Gilvimarinus polysaccharolyticus TaxID=863921 RepID=UPI000673BEAF|nr:hypothetical protein [Gilvimarinus polysaccharolyticus]
MKKILLGVPAALLVFIVASKLYYSYQLDKNVGLLASQLRGFGVELSYKNAEVTFAGDIKVEGIFLQSPAIHLSFSIDKVAITTGSILNVHTVLNDLKSHYLPTELGLEFEGVRLPITLLSDTDPDPLNLPLISMPSCGTGSSIADNEWSDVGYSYIDIKASTLSYRIIGAGQQVNIQLVNDVSDMYRSTLNAEISLGATSRSMASIASASSDATLLNFNLDYQDRGLNHKIMQYCEAQSELDSAELQNSQIKDWQDAWRQQGLEAGPKMVELYQTFLQNSDTVKLEADAIGSVSVADFNPDQPLAILHNFKTMARVNNQAAVELDIHKMPSDQAQQWKTQYILAKNPIEEKNIEINLHRDKKVDIPLDDLANHLNEELFIEIKNGNTISGRLLSLGDRSVQLQVSRGAGYMIGPIKYSDVSRVYVITKRKQ